MIQKLTWIKLTDSSMTQWVRTFHLYGGFWRTTSTVGLYIKGSVRIVLPPNFYYKGFTKRIVVKGKIVRSMIIRVKYKYSYGFILYPSTCLNSSIVIKKKNLIKIKHLFGPLFNQYRHKRIRGLFKSIV